MSYRIRFTLPDGRTGLWTPTYATREEAQRLIGERQQETGLAYVVEDVVTPEARIRELEAELAQLRDAYDAARQDLDVAKRNVARLESTLAMVQASWAASVASADVARAASTEAHCKVVASVARLDRALALGDAMYLALTTTQPYLAGRGAMGEWEAYKHTLAVSRQGPAKASEAPGEGGDSGEGEK